jgi:hypothetical protein
MNDSDIVDALDLNRAELARLAGDAATAWVNVRRAADDGDPAAVRAYAYQASVFMRVALMLAEDLEGAHDR